MWTAAAARSQGFLHHFFRRVLKVGAGTVRGDVVAARQRQELIHERARSCGPEGAVQGVEDGRGLSCLRRGIGGALYLYAHGGDQLCGGRWCPDSRSYGLYVRIDT